MKEEASKLLEKIKEDLWHQGKEYVLQEASKKSLIKEINIVQSDFIKL